MMHVSPGRRNQRLVAPPTSESPNRTMEACWTGGATGPVPVVFGNEVFFFFFRRLLFFLTLTPLPSPSSCSWPETVGAVGPEGAVDGRDTRTGGGGGGGCARSPRPFLRLARFPRPEPAPTSAELELATAGRGPVAGGLRGARGGGGLDSTSAKETGPALWGPGTLPWENAPSGRPEPGLSHPMECRLWQKSTYLSSSVMVVLAVTGRICSSTAGGQGLGGCAPVRRTSHSPSSRLNLSSCRFSVASTLSTLEVRVTSSLRKPSCTASTVFADSVDIPV